MLVLVCCYVRAGLHICSRGLLCVDRLPPDSEPPNYTDEIRIPVIAILSNDADIILQRYASAQSMNGTITATINAQGLTWQTYEPTTRWDELLRLASIFLPFIVVAYSGALFFFALFRHLQRARTRTLVANNLNNNNNNVINNINNPNGQNNAADNIALQSSQRRGSNSSLEDGSNGVLLSSQAQSDELQQAQE